MPGRIFTVPPPQRAMESTAAWITFSVEPTRSAFCGPTVMVSDSFHSGSTGSPEVARGFVTGTGFSLAAPARSPEELPIATPLEAAVAKNLRRFMFYLPVLQVD